MVVGIIAEYNPFHNGHHYQIEAVRKKYPDAAIVVAMSGQFTQRGTPVIFDKWTRARHAILGGGNLVLELPLVFATRSAQQFAFGGVDLLEKIEVTDVLAFGVESPEESLLFRMAEHYETEEMQSTIRLGVEEGKSYAQAVSRALREKFHVTEKFLRQPNLILGLEYLRALGRRKKITPCQILRKEAGHGDEKLGTHFASGTAIRRAVTEGRSTAHVVPQATQEDLARLKEAPTLERMKDAFFWKCMREGLAELRTFAGIKEGLEYRFRAGIKTEISLEGLARAVSTRRYPLAQIQRTMLHLLLELKKEELNRFDEAGAQYARVLAFDARGQELLRAIKKKSSVPVVTKVANFFCSKDFERTQKTIAEQMFAYDVWGTELWRHCSRQRILSDFEAEIFRRIV